MATDLTWAEIYKERFIVFTIMANFKWFILFILSILRFSYNFSDFEQSDMTIIWSCYQIGCILTQGNTPDLDYYLINRE